MNPINKTLRVVFFGSSNHFFSNAVLEYLVKKDNIEIPLVIYQPPKKTSNHLLNKITNFIRKNLINFDKLNKNSKSFEDIIKKKIKTHNPLSFELNSSKFIEIIKNTNPHLIISVCYSQILSRKIIKLPKITTIGIHPSLLPKYRGSHPVFWAVLNKEVHFGITAYHMDEGIDTGDIICQESIKTRRLNKTKVLNYFFLTKLYKFIVRQTYISLLDNIINYSISNVLPRTKQEESNSTYFKSPKFKDLFNILR